MTKHSSSRYMLAGMMMIFCCWNDNLRSVRGYCIVHISPSSSFVMGRQGLWNFRLPTRGRSNNNIVSMKIKVGIVGLPNVGKSTLFNALAQKSIARAENFPFCTIEPNVAPIAVPDAHLEPLSHLAQSIKTVPAMMEFIDVAGLVAGASRGEGLGNRFLATIRECNVICHVVRQFDSADIVHVQGGVDPRQDAEVVNLELVLADIAHVERRLDKTTCRDEERATLEKILPELEKGQPARSLGLSPSEEFSIKSMGLLTLKPVIYVFNVDEVDFLLDREKVNEDVGRILDEIQYSGPSSTRDLSTVVSAKLEAEIAAMQDLSAQQEYVQSMTGKVDHKGNDDDDDDVDNTSTIDNLLCYRVLPALVRQLLDLYLVYTGPGVPIEKSQTTKAHLFETKNPPSTLQLAGRLHGEIQRGFIRAEVTPAQTLLQYASYNAAKDAGVVRTEGKDAKLLEDDVVLVKWK